RSLAAPDRVYGRKGVREADRPRRSAGSGHLSFESTRTRLMTSSHRAEANDPLYLEDLHVGQRFVSGTHQLDEAQVIAFARQYDPQPFHVDPEAAKTTFFRGLVASGWHIAAITMRLLVDSPLKVAGGQIGAGAEIQWPRPIRPDALLHVESEAIEVRPSRS